MPQHRYYLDKPLIEGSSITLEDNEFHHLSHVMRAQVGDTVEVVNGKHKLALAKITAILKKKAQLHLTQVIERSPPKRTLILAQALPKLNNLELILEKGTEVGATHFWLFPGVLSEKSEVKHNQVEKLKSWVIAAIKQCGRLDLPEIVIKPPLKDWKKPEQKLYFGDVDPEAPWYAPQENELIFFVGPERGWHPSEEDILQQWDAQGVKISENILRTETAGLVALVQSIVLSKSH